MTVDQMAAIVRASVHPLSGVRLLATEIEKQAGYRPSTNTVMEACVKARLRDPVQLARVLRLIRRSRSSNPGTR
jgi:hypothetical protein